MASQEFQNLKQRSLFARLKKLFSTDVIVRNIGGKQLKVVDTDEAMYATDRNTLRDRFNRVRTSAFNQYSRDFSLSYQASRIELFRDYDTMDMDPIIASALDIYADECLDGETIIPLLNGDKVKIKDLYNRNEKNFWVYSINNEGNLKPEICERVAYNGKKRMYKITLDDNTEIKCTANHQWVLSNNEVICTDKLKFGDSLKVMQTKLSANKFMNGYEMIQDGDGKWKYTHRIVANSINTLIEQKNTLNSKNKVIHHTSFNKLNNAPDCLKWMDYTDHRKLHSDFNKELWSDTTKTHKYKTKIIEAHEKYWTPEVREAKANHQREVMKAKIASMSLEEKKLMYGCKGDKNGMFENGNKISGDRNGRWKNFTSLDCINISDYEMDIINGMSFKCIQNKYNLGRNNTLKLNKLICKKYDIKKIDMLPYKLRSNVLDTKINISNVKNVAINELNSGKNIYRNLTCVSEHFNISNDELFKFITKKGYTGIRDLVESTNHRIVSIELLQEEYDAYDLVNVGNTTHIYAIETKDNSKLFTHNCITKNELGSILTIHSENDNIKQILENLFYDILNIEFNLWSWTRNLVKYGDFYLKLHISPEFGIYMVEPMSAYNVTRVENSNLDNKAYVKFQVNLPEGGKIENIENYQMAHFRMLSDSNFLPYGKSMIENGRRVWKQLSLMEDAMLIHRVMRAPEKRIFKIDVGNLPPQEIDTYMEKLMAKMQKTPYIDEKTGDYNLKFNLQNMAEDFYLPVRGGDSGTSIEPLQGMEFTGIDDIEYLRNKMMAALKIPKAFLTYEEDLSGKATLAQEDVRFAKTILRVQRILVSELNKMAIVHLYSQGYKDSALVDFKLELTNPSVIFETEKIKSWGDKISVAKDMMEQKLFSKQWIYDKIFHMSEDDIVKLTNDIIDDSKQSYRFKQIEEEGNDPAKPFDKIKPEGDESASAGGNESGGEEPPAEGESSEAPEAPAPAETPAAPGPVSEKLKRPYVRASQKGKKKSSDYPFGEDKIGKLSFSTRNDTDPIRHSYKNTGPLNFESLNKYLTSLESDKADLLNENVHKTGSRKSYLDESNIL